MEDKIVPGGDLERYLFERAHLGDEEALKILLGPYDMAGSSGRDVIAPAGALERYLVRRAHQKDDDAFERLLDFYNQRMTRLARSVLNNRCREQDALQNAVMAIRGELHRIEFDWDRPSTRKPGAVGKREPLWAWMYTIIYRACLAISKRESRRQGGP